MRHAPAVWGVLIFLTLALLVACTNQTRTSAAGVQYDSEILTKFHTISEVRVLVTLRDYSNITIEGTNEERIILMRQKHEWFKPRIAEILSSIPPTEITNIDERVRGFSASVSRDGFNWLLSNSEIERITLIESITPRLYPNPESCLTNKVVLYGNLDDYIWQYEPGVLILQLEPGTTEEDVSVLLKSLGLELDYLTRVVSGETPQLAIAKGVSSGSEYQMMCQLEQSPFITTASPSSTGTVFS